MLDWEQKVKQHVIELKYIGIKQNTKNKTDSLDVQNATEIHLYTGVLYRINRYYV